MSQFQILEVLDSRKGKKFTSKQIVTIIGATNPRCVFNSLEKLRGYDAINFQKHGKNFVYWSKSKEEGIMKNILNTTIFELQKTAHLSVGLAYFLMGLLMAGSIIFWKNHITEVGVLVSIFMFYKCYITMKKYYEIKEILGEENKNKRGDINGNNKQFDNIGNGSSICSDTSGTESDGNKKGYKESEVNDGKN